MARCRDCQALAHRARQMPLWLPTRSISEGLRSNDLHFARRSRRYLGHPQIRLPYDHSNPLNPNYYFSRYLRSSSPVDQGVRALENRLSESGQPGCSSSLQSNDSSSRSGSRCADSRAGVQGYRSRVGVYALEGKHVRLKPHLQGWWDYAAQRYRYLGHPQIRLPYDHNDPLNPNYYFSRCLRSSSPAPPHCPQRYLGHPQIGFRHAHHNQLNLRAEIYGCPKLKSNAPPPIPTGHKLRRESIGIY